MRITFVCTDRQAALADARRCPTRLRGLAGAFRNAEHEVQVLAAGPQAPFDGIAVREMRLPVTSREVDWHFAQLNPELVIEHWMPGQTACAEAAAAERLPLLIDVSPEQLGGEYDDALLATVAAANGHAGLLVASDRDAERARLLVGPLVTVHVLEDAVRPELLAEPDPALASQVATRLRLHEREPRIAFLGPLTRESGVLDLLRGIAAAAEERAFDPMPRVVVIGDGPARNETLALAFEHGVRLTLCGRVADDELGAHLGASAIVYAGSGAGPLPLLQAMACERLVVAADTAESRRILRSGEDGWLVPEGDVATLARTLGELLANTDQALKVGRRARLVVSDGYTWDAQVERLVALGAGMHANLQERAG